MLYSMATLGVERGTTCTREAIGRGEISNYLSECYGNNTIIIIMNTFIVWLWATPTTEKRFLFGWRYNGIDRTIAKIDNISKEFADIGKKSTGTQRGQIEAYRLSGWSHYSLIKRMPEKNVKSNFPHRCAHLFFLSISVC